MNTATGTNGSTPEEIEERNELTKEVLGFEKDSRTRFTKFDPNAKGQDSKLADRYEEIAAKIEGYEVKFKKPFPLHSATEFRAEILNVWERFSAKWSPMTIDDFEKIDVAQSGHEQEFLDDYHPMKALIDQYHMLYGRTFRPEGDVGGNGTANGGGDPLAGVERTPNFREKWAARFKNFRMPVSRRGLVIGGSTAAVLGLLFAGFRYGPDVWEFVSDLMPDSPAVTVADTPPAKKADQKKALAKAAPVVSAVKASAVAVPATAATPPPVTAKPDAPAPDTPIAGMPGGPMPGLHAAAVTSPPADANSALKPPLVAKAESSTQRADTRQKKATPPKQAKAATQPSVRERPGSRAQSAQTPVAAATTAPSAAAPAQQAAAGIPAKVQAIEVEFIPLNVVFMDHPHVLDKTSCAGNFGKKVKVAAGKTPDGRQIWDWYTCK